jgi:hypothetical protein
MAFGQKQVYVASLQPGTTNLPYGVTIPGGKGGAATYIPPFVPVVITSTDTAAAMIAAASAAMVADIEAVTLAIIGAPGVPGTFSTIEAQLSAINTGLSKVADNITAFSSLLHELDVYVQAAGVMVNSKSFSNAVETGHKVKFNNYTMANSGATPNMPPLKEQLTEIVKDAQDMKVIARASTLITGTINDVMTGITNWAKDTVVYKTVANWIKSITSSLTMPAIPSLETIASKLKSFLGIKGP